MERRYEVYIGGRRVMITDEPVEINGTDPSERVPIRSEEDLDKALRSIHGSATDRSFILFPREGYPLWDRFSARSKFVQAAGGAVQDQHDRLLVIKRLGKWDLPKGKIEKGESIEAAALREVEEECGIDGLKILRPLTITWHTYERNGKDHLKRTDWFLMTASSGKELTPQIEEDIEEVRWMTQEEVDRMKEDTYPSLLKVIEAWRSAR